MDISTERLFQKINGKAWDWRIRSFDGWTLRLSGGCSIEYSTPLVQFNGVTYLACPFEFRHPAFRLATKTERADIAMLVPLDKQDVVIIIEAETMAGLTVNKFSIVVESWTFPSET